MNDINKELEEIEDLLKNVEESQIRIIALRDKLKSKNEDKKPAPKQRLLELFNGCEIKIDKEKYPNSIFYMKNGKYFFEIEKEYLWCSYGNVWSIFYNEYNMNYDQVQSLIKNTVEEYFKMKEVTPIYFNLSLDKLVEEYFKMKEVTPEFVDKALYDKVEEYFKMKEVTPSI